MKTRDSNMELLRIVAMLMVVLVHTCFCTTGTPTKADVSVEPIISFFRLFIPACTIVCVNLFVLISGWFGIKHNKKSFLNLTFQVIFFLLITLPFAFLNRNEVSSNEIFSFLLLEDYDNWWFVKSYFLLYLLSPVLNSFTEKSTEKEMRIVLCGFYCFMFSWGWLIPGVKWFYNGYSTISFMGLYLLARYCNLYANKISFLSKNKCLLGYVFITLLLAVSSYLIVILMNGPTKNVVHMLYDYNSPFVVVSSLFLFLYFSKLSFQSRMINRIARSVFAVYLFHTSKFVFPIFIITLFDFYHSHPYYLYLLFSIATTFIVFLISIMIDSVRIAMWQRLISRIVKS